MMLTDAPVYYAGGGFPWGLLIIGGIVYFLWQKGVFGGPGRHGHGHGPQYGGPGPGVYPPATPNAPGASFGPGGPGFRGPREHFAEWHREAHAADATPPQAPAPSPAAPTTAASSTVEPAAPGSEDSAR